MDTTTTTVETPVKPVAKKRVRKKKAVETPITETVMTPKKAKDWKPPTTSEERTALALEVKRLHQKYMEMYADYNKIAQEYGDLNFLMQMGKHRNNIYEAPAFYNISGYPNCCGAGALYLGGYSNSSLETIFKDAGRMRRGLLTGVFTLHERYVKRKDWESYVYPQKLYKAFKEAGAVFSAPVYNWGHGPNYLIGMSVVVPEKYRT